MRSSYSDPTANAAVARYDRERRAAERLRKARERAELAGEEFSEPKPRELRRASCACGWTIAWTAPENRNNS